MNDTIDLDEIERLAKAATPGPWIAGDHYEQSTPGNYVASKTTHGIVCASQDYTDCPLSYADADYIAHMHPARVLALVERVRRVSGAHRQALEEQIRYIDERDAALARIAELEAELEATRNSLDRIAKQAGFTRN